MNIFLLLFSVSSNSKTILDFIWKFTETKRHHSTLWGRRQKVENFIGKIWNTERINDQNVEIVEQNLFWLASQNDWQNQQNEISFQVKMREHVHLTICSAFRIESMSNENEPLWSANLYFILSCRFWWKDLSYKCIWP